MFYWESWSAPTPDDEWRWVRVEEVDLTGVPEEFAAHWFRGLSWEQWLARDPIFLHREYNWREVGGRWRRTYVGIGNGRHRLLIATRRGVETLRVQVGECAFFPAGERPSDRSDVGRGHFCFHHDDFDPSLRTWLRPPRHTREHAADCGSLDPGT